MKRQERMAALLDGAEDAVAALRDPDWRIRYAAAVALERRRDPAVVPALLAALELENAAPLYTQREEPPPDAATREAWSRRGRVKQAVYFALAALGTSAAPALSAAAADAVDPAEDYAVRMAACRVLGAVGGAEALRVLAQAAADVEVCTSLEATRQLRLVREREMRS